MSLKSWWRANRKTYFARIAIITVRALCRTLRYDLRGAVPPKDATKLVICGWHGKSLPFAYAFRDRGYVVMISNSNDGDVQHAVFDSMGFVSIRGSSGRGGERALVGAIKALRSGGVMAMTPDGPRGPSGEVQVGVVAMAQRSGALLVPVGIAAAPNKRARSWDRFLIPSPFARVVMVFGEGMAVALDDDVDEVARTFGAEIDRLEDEAAAWLHLPKETELRQAASLSSVRK